VLVTQVTQREEGVDAQARFWGLAHVLAGERIEPPRGDGHLSTIWKFDDDTLRGLASQPPQHFYGLPKEGMMRIPDLGDRRRMCSVEIRSATRVPRICWKPATIFAPSRNCSGIKT
jgi:hypothetical protein